MYLFQRIVPNEFGWTRPSPGRLKDPTSKDSYLDFTGFGHEDWNFNANLAVKGWIYGYLYYAPAHQESEYNIAFASYEPGLGWYLAGFYIEAEHVPGGAPVTKTVLTAKAKHLRALEAAGSLANGYDNLADARLLARIGQDAPDYRWRVRPRNILALEQPVLIRSSVFTPGSYHYRRPEFLTRAQFEALRKLGRVRARRSELAEGDDDADYFEGDQYEAKHKLRERNRDLVKAAKARFIRLHGRLFCEACEFDFQAVYGTRGKDFIEAHHLTQHGQLSGRTRVRMEDLAMLCSNCHRMVHRERSMLTVKGLRTLLGK